MATVWVDKGESAGLAHRNRLSAPSGLVVVTLLVACGGQSQVRSTHSATLTSGRWNGQTWSLTLDNANPNHEWCWELTGPIHPSGACGFNDPHDPTTGPSDSQPLDDSHDLEYGPAPVGATKVVLVSVELPAQVSETDSGGFTSAAQPAVPSAGPPMTVVPHPLPEWAPPGLWWTAVVRSGIWQPHFYDAAGHELPPTRY